MKQIEEPEAKPVYQNLDTARAYHHHQFKDGVHHLRGAYEWVLVDDEDFKTDYIKIA